MSFKESSDPNTHDWDTIANILEEYPTADPIKNIELKRQAFKFLGFELSKKLNKNEIRQLVAKARKMKNSNKKEERFKDHELEKRVIQAFNLTK